MHAGIASLFSFSFQYYHVGLEAVDLTHTLAEYHDHHTAPCSSVFAGKRHQWSRYVKRQRKEINLKVPTRPIDDNIILYNSFSPCLKYIERGKKFLKGANDTEVEDGYVQYFFRAQVHLASYQPRVRNLFGLLKVREYYLKLGRAPTSFRYYHGR